VIGRLKFDIDPLVIQMLDQIPEDVVVNGTVLDPAIGGGQFVKEVERRKRAAGKTDAEISATVFGIEQNVLRKNYAVNKHKLVGNYTVDNFLEKDFKDMKFDVIVGNPPYQGSNDKGTAQPKSHNLWSKFIDKSINLVKDNGYVSFVTPDSWMSANSQLLIKFKEQSLSWVNTNVGKYFNVGSSFTAWSLQKNNKGTTCEIDGLPVQIDKLNYLPRDFHNSYPIHNKVINSNFSKLKVCGDTTCHSDHKHKKLSDNKDAVYKYKTHHTNAQTKFSKLKSKDFDKKKVLWSLSGYFKPFYDPGTIGTTEICQYVLVNNDIEGKNVLSYLNSKIYQYIITTGKWSGFLNGRVIEGLPELPNKNYTDQDLYKLFNLTADEIIIVENAIK